MCKANYSLNVHDFLIIFVRGAILITVRYTIFNNEHKMLRRQSSFQQLQFDCTKISVLSGCICRIHNNYMGNEPFRWCFIEAYPFKFDYYNLWSLRVNLIFIIKNWSWCSLVTSATAFMIFQFVPIRNSPVLNIKTFYNLCIIPFK